MLNGLAGKRVLVTGAGSGIGAGIAEAFGRLGAVLGLHCHRSEGEARALAGRLRSAGGKAEVLPGDLLDPKVRASLVDRFVEIFGGIDVLVNNAGGVLGMDHFLDLDEIAWQETFALNALAPFRLAQAAFRRMQDQGGGRIINITSIGVKFGGSPWTLHYSSAKGGLETLTLGLARAGAPHNILVNAVRPGLIDTPFHAKVPKPDLNARVDLIPLKRLGQPADVAHLVVYLASPGGDFITGQIFAVSGGD